MKLYGVIGDPVDHSLSPAIHRQFFFDTKIDGVYEKFFIPKGELEKGIRLLKMKKIKGFNVTIPHKRAIIPLLDEVDETARQIGAVNTVVEKNGKLIGYNTDEFGFMRALKSVVNDLAGKKIAIIGAGGAARAVYFSLKKEDVLKIDVANRTVENGVRLIRDGNGEDLSDALTLDQLQERIANYEIIVQTTPIGMYPNVLEQPIRLDLLKEGTVVFDLIYRPLETVFLTSAKKNGAICVNGVDMLLYQAAQSFFLWTGIFPHIESAREWMMKQ
ncbi:shikimate dehydrogenase [Fervidibacillus albus]|uniref:Shikimate dehydrogenase (NADP(+)) n=1 Tax=Fervidibacillus albus TaxID=2980026 RepID=A0A9E8RWI8_9BACI|nr:shikimate dehydrogenase [Fervidibacillus albus]WAA10349.1 shikimate dehydrogenase [Fervidibacillus albus]